MEIIQIVPRLPPAICGVGDYSLLLASELYGKYKIRTKFVVSDPEWNGRKEIREFPIVKVESRTAESLKNLLVDQASLENPIILQYVGYGYEKRGCPLWLVQGLKNWKTELIGRKLTVMFHELYAFGPPWRSSFWTSPIQQALTRSLALISDYCITSIQQYVCELRQLTSRPKLSVLKLPVFSNIGEPNVLPTYQHRKPQMIVFGGASWRQKIYTQHRSALENACRELNLSEVVDVGPACNVTPRLTVPWVRKGTLSREQIGRELLKSRAGYFSQPSSRLGKSGVFAAYAAFGILPVTYGSNILPNNDGVIPGKHYLPVSSKSICDERDAENIAQSVRKWYESHCIYKHAEYYNKIMTNANAMSEALSETA